MTKKQSDNKLNIYTKLQKIQSEIKELIRTEKNKFQNYFFFNELQVLQLLKPLLNKYHLTILLSDDTTQPFIHEKEGKEHYVKYLKKLEIIDTENPDNKLLFNFWACGSNVDLAKAKGSSETYAIKYLLSKFFLMPVKDEGDPDYRQREEKEKNIEQTLTELAQEANDPSTISIQQVESLIDLLRQKSKGDKEIQSKFVVELDQLLAKKGIEGTTNAGNFKMRLSSLTPMDYQWLYNWLLKIEKV